MQYCLLKVSSLEFELYNTLQEYYWPFTIDSKFLVTCNNCVDNNTMKDYMAVSFAFSLTGPRALYKGLGPTLVRCFPACGALFVAYEGTQQLLFNV